jgi:hypothetical protein
MPPLKQFRPNNSGQQIDDQNNADETDNDIQHGYNLAQALANNTQRPKKIMVTMQ